jgi:hypothetical protein
VKPVHARIVGGLLPDVDDPGVDLLPRLVDDLLDPPRMDAPVGDELLESNASDLTADGIEARDDDGVGGIVDDHVHARRQLERADVPTLAPDDSPFHLVVR